MKIDTDVQAIISFCLRNSRGCNVGITEGRVLLSAPLKFALVTYIRTKFHGDLLRRLSNITVITKTILETVKFDITDRSDLWSMPLRWLHVE
jgi:hypothetical protein